MTKALDADTAFEGAVALLCLARTPARQIEVFSFQDDAQLPLVVLV